MKIDEERIKGHLDRIVRGTVEETLNSLLDAEADRLVGAERYARTDERRVVSNFFRTFEFGWAAPEPGSGCCVGGLVVLQQVHR